MAVPQSSIAIDFSGNQDEVHEQIKSLCKSILPGWGNVPEEQFKFSKISGGISNILVKVDPSGFNGLFPVAVKVFGDKTELFIDRESEKTILVQLNKHNFGAQVLAFFENGRIEAFFNCKTLTPDEMSDPEMVPSIAKRLRAFHELPIDLPGRQEASVTADAAKASSSPEVDPTFNVIWNWLTMAEGLTFEDTAKRAAFEKIDLKSMRREIEELQSLRRRLNSPTVFAHCDLLSGNILIVQEKAGAGSGDASASAEDFASRPAAELLRSDGDAKLQFIDFEYSCYTTRGFDLGNHFNEYAGFDCDYGKYPDAASQRRFLDSYLSAAERSEEALAALAAEANFFALVSHVYWGVWALIQARYSAIDFDYIGYSELRWSEYFRRKVEFTAPLGSTEPGGCK